MSVEENLQVAAAVRGTAGFAAIDGLFERFPILRTRRALPAGALSGGEQQLLALARCLCAKPKLVLLDEPTEGIQPSIIQELARTLRRIRDERGLSIIASEQVLGFALDIADRVLVIEGGNIVHQDARADVDEATVARYLAV